MSQVTSRDDEIGRILREARERKGLGKGELARRVGSNRKTITNWEEKGQVPTHARLLQGLRRELDLTAEELPGPNSRQLQLEAATVQLVQTGNALADAAQALVDLRDDIKPLLEEQRSLVGEMRKLVNQLRRLATARTSG